MTTRRTRAMREEPEEPTPFFCPFSTKAEELEERVSTLEAGVASVAGLKALVVEIEDDLTDEAEAARDREDELEDRTEALERRLEAVEFRAAELEGLREKVADLEQEVLAVAERALAGTTPTEITEGACVWDRHDGRASVAIAKTIMDLHETGRATNRRVHRVIGWVVHEADGSYRSRPAAELSTVRPRRMSYQSNTLEKSLFALAVVAFTALLTLLATRS